VIPKDFADLPGRFAVRRLNQNFALAGSERHRPRLSLKRDHPSPDRRLAHCSPPPPELADPRVVHQRLSLFDRFLAAPAENKHPPPVPFQHQVIIIWTDAERRPELELARP
jgi:hypothetical protein